MTSRAVDTRLLQRGRGAAPMLLASVAGGILTAILVLVQAVLLAAIVSRVFIGQEGLGALGGDIAMLGVVFVARAIVAWSRQVFAARAAIAVKRSLRHDLLAAVLRRSPESAPGGGELVVQLIQGVDALDSYFARYLPELMLGALVPLVGVIWVATIDLLSAAILVITVPLIPVFMILIGGIADQQTAKRWNRLQSLAGTFQEMVRGMTVLRIFNRTRDWLSRLEESSNELRRATMATLRIAFLSALALELIATISTALVAVGIGLRVVYGQIDFQPALAVLIMAPEVYLPLRRVGAEYHAAMEGVKASEAAFSLIDTPSRHGNSRAPDVSKASITIDRVGVRSGDRTLLSNVSLRVAPGDFVAITGASGAGKSTLLRMLLGFIAPTSGHITVGGIDLREVDRRTWLEQLSYLPQDPFFMAGSVRSNLRLADPQATDEVLWRALESSGLADFVASLPAGIDSGVGEAGKLLSAGQRRRLAVARTLIRRSPMILLDEPTANVDAETREVLAGAIASLAHSSTIVAVVHDLDLARLADRRIEIDAT